MKNININMNIVALSIFLSLSSVEAVESLSTAELALHCSHYQTDPKGKDAVFCVRYIQGFIDGAIATDERVISNIVKENAQKKLFQNVQ